MDTSSILRAFIKAKVIKVSNWKDERGEKDKFSRILIQSLVKRKSQFRVYSLNIHPNFSSVRDNAMTPSFEVLDGYAFMTTIRWRNQNHIKHGYFRKLHVSPEFGVEIAPSKNAFVADMELKHVLLFFLGEAVYHLKT